MITKINEFAKKVAPIYQSQNISAKSLEIAMMKQAKKAGLKLTWVSVLLSMGGHHKPGNYIGITVRYERLPVPPAKLPRQSQEKYEAIVEEFPAEKLNQAFKDFIVPGMEYPQDLEFEYYGTDDHEYYTIFDLQSGIVMTENKVFEGINAYSFTDGLVSQMGKYMPKNMWTVEGSNGQIIVTNDFEETATYRIVKYESNEGTFNAPNIPFEGSADNS